MRRMETRVPVRFVSVVLTGMVLWIVTACGSIGPSSVQRDRFDYITAISESWKQQMLLNIVRLRYADVPVFMDVGQVISTYELEGTLAASGAISGGDIVNLGAGGRYLDRPTVTYSPLTGNDFVKTMMTPFPPGAVMFLVEAGWPVDLLLQVATQSINGLRNNRGGPQGHEADPEFVEVIRLLKRIQGSGGMGFKLQLEKENEKANIMLFHTHRLTPEVIKDVADVKRLLRVNPEATDIRITYGADSGGGQEIALHTRSGYQVLIELASLVAVPPEHVKEHRTWGLPPRLEGMVLPPMLSIQSGSERPVDSFAQIRYREHWYWIDDRNLLSKRTFTFLTILFSLSETGEQIQQPVLTIQAN